MSETERWEIGEVEWTSWGACRQVVTAADRELIGWIECPEGDPARAALAAAAPELLAACEAYVDRCPMCQAEMECHDDLCYQMRAAIAAAIGVETF